LLEKVYEIPFINLKYDSTEIVLPGKLK